ncbi:MAG: Holliday junction resolvase YqgF [Chloroflexi bacterium]|nr:Holliday junction resolvase YqgF [Chloroflexota bacterium]
MARILALDVGSKRIGLAVSDELGVIATPRGALQRRSYNKDAAAIDELLHDLDAARIVVGLPTGLSGRPTEQTKRVERFAAMLASRVSVPVDLWDERLTTAMARSTGQISNQDRRTGRLDALAAAYILQSYLDRRAMSSSFSS